MKKLNLKEILIPTAALFIICVCVTGLLAFTNSLTKEPIIRQNEKIAIQSRQTVCPDAKSFDEVSINNKDAQCYAAKDSSGKVIGYAISTKATGYGGDIKVMTGIDAVTQEVIAVNVYDNSNETPGLGVKTSTDSFVNQFKGKIPADGFVVNKDASGSKSQSIDAVTGATISSRAVVKPVNEAIKIYQSVKGGGQ